MEDYFQAKRLLFASPLTGARIANADDAYGRRLAEEFPDGSRSRSTREADYRAVDVRTERTGCASSPPRRTASSPRACRCPGASTCSTRSARGRRRGRWARRPDGLAASLRGAATAPGRFQPVDAGQPFGVVVDYAHKPDALEQVLLAAREMAGAADRRRRRGGDRDRGKRPLMGEIAARLAEVALITSDNPRSEEPSAIIDEIVAGIPSPRMPRSRATWTGGPRSSGRSRSPGPATSS